MLKTFLTASAIGCFSILLIVYSVALSIGLIAQVAEWKSFTLSLGPILFFEHFRDESSFGTAFGVGLFLLAILGGLANGIVAAWLQSRRREGSAWGRFPRGFPADDGHRPRHRSAGV